MIRNGHAAMLLAIAAAVVDSKSDVLARSAPPAADPEIRHSVLMAGRPIGLQTGRRSDDGSLHFAY
jgi:hypothetical protein